MTGLDLRTLAAAVARADLEVDRWWDEHLRGRPAVDRLFYTASEVADFSVLWHTLGTARALVTGDESAAVALSVALGVESALINGPVKSRFRRPRPLGSDVRPHRLRQPRTTSFPSGHATAAMVAAAMLSRRGRLGPVWYATAAVVAASRVHVRIHHASDVVGGVAIGAVLGGVARRVADRLGV